MGNRKQSKLLASLSTLSTVESKSDLTSAVFHMRDTYKFAHLVFMVFRSLNRPTVWPVHATTYPEQWTDLYVERDYVAIDPVTQIWQTGVLPVDWSDLDWKPTKTRAFLREAVNFGVGRHGVTIPVRGPNGERSLLSATANTSASEWRKIRKSCDHDLQVLSAYLHEKMVAVSGLRTNFPQRDLSKREQECLQLLAKGMVPKRIASSLRLSESAVRLYLGSARRKLNAATIYETIANAAFHEKISF